MNFNFIHVIVLSVFLNLGDLIAQTQAQEKIDGVSLVSPPRPFPVEYLSPIYDKVCANWMAISPYGFCRPNEAVVHYNSNRQWWGETLEGAKAIIEMAQKQELKIMLKPQVWMMHEWIGNFDLESEKDWEIWEKSYRSFILDFAKLAADKKVEIFCIGTEYKIAAVKREKYWRKLIKEVREIYTGQLTYAANWDNYQNISFWDQLDFIGIDSYFPLTDEQMPSVKSIVLAWNEIAKEMEQFSKKNNKLILFPEFGYMSCDYTGWKNWENEGKVDQLSINLQAQANAFEGFFTSMWDNDWFAGGFIWKWFPNYEQAGGEENKQYTPQRKPAEKVIMNWYK